MSGGASFDAPGSGGPGVPFTGGPLGAVGAPVDNSGLGTSAIMLLIQAWNSNTAALSSLIGTLGKVVSIASYTFANLPASPGIGQLAVCTNANANTWGTAITGAGADTVLTWWNGAAWTVIGK